MGVVSRDLGWDDDDDDDMDGAGPLVLPANRQPNKDYHDILVIQPYRYVVTVIKAISLLSSQTSTPCHTDRAMQVQSTSETFQNLSYPQFSCIQMHPVNLIQYAEFLSQISRDSC